MNHKLARTNHKLVRVFVILLVVPVFVFCGKQVPQGEAEEDSGSQSSEAEAGPHDSGSSEGLDDGGDLQDSDESGDSEPVDSVAPVEEWDETQSVDVGNPKDTGPDKKGRVRLYLADLPIDGATGFVIQPETLYLAQAGGGILGSQGTYDPVDLLQFQGGDLWRMTEVALPVGEYTGLGVTLGGPALMVADTGDTEVALEAIDPIVSLPGSVTNRLGIADELAFSVFEGQTVDLVLHVDLQFGLKTDGETITLEAGQDLYRAGTRGSLDVLGLAEPGVLCLYQDEVPPSILDAVSQPILDLGDPLAEFGDCDGAQARAVANGEDLTMAHLRPGAFAPVVILPTGPVIVPLDVEIEPGGVATMDLEGVL